MERFSRIARRLVASRLVVCRLILAVAGSGLPLVSAFPGPASAQPRPAPLAPLPAQDPRGAAPAPLQDPRAAPPAPPRPAALKTFQRADLAEAARRYEKVVRREAQSPNRPLAQVKRDADAAFARPDARTAATLYASLALANPQDSAVWLRLAQSLLSIRPGDGEDRYTFTDRALGAAYLAYRRASTRQEEGQALAVIGHIYMERSLWRAAIDTMKASLDLRADPAEQAFLDRLKAEHGFRLLDYSVESDLAAPRACAQFSEDIDGTAADIASFVSVAGMDKPAVSFEARQICVEGLKHGERYDIAVRAGVPSVVGEKLAKPVELSIYVRDRAPSARFTGRNYVLPRTGQKGLPVVSVNTRAVAIKVLRIGDRGLVPTALDGEFRNALETYVRERLAEGAAIALFDGTLETDNPLNEEVVTAIPVSEAVGTLQPGVYAMTARPADPVPNDEDSSSEATQWFIVSDLGLTALSGQDGVHVLVRSLGSAEPLAGVKVRLIAKSNEVLGTADTGPDGHVRFPPGLARGPAGLSPEAVVAELPGDKTGKGGDYAFLSLKESGFDLTDRGVSGREPPGPLDVFLATERGVYRSGETVHVTALLRNAQGSAAARVPLTFALDRPDGVEDRRLSSDDAGAGGRTLSLSLLRGAMTGTWRLKAFSDPKAPAIGEATFLVEDYLPDRVEFDIAPAASAVPRGRAADLALSGRYLYGAPAAALDVEAETELRLAPDGRRAFPGYRFGNEDESVLSRREPVADTPKTDGKGNARLSIATGELPRTSRPLEVEAIVRLVEPGGRAVQRAVTLPVAPGEAQIGVKPLFDTRVTEGSDAAFDVVVADVDDRLLARSGLKWQLSRIETRYQWYKVSGSWDYEPIKTVTRVGEGEIAATAEGPARLALPTQYGRYRLDVSGPGLPLTSLFFSSGYGGEAAADTPDRLDLTLAKDAYAAGDALEATITARMAGTATVLVLNEKLLEQRVVSVSPGANSVRFVVGPDWGPGAYVVAFLHRPLDVNAGRMPGRSIGLAWFSVDKAARTLDVSLAAPAEVKPNGELSVPVTLAGLKGGEDAYVTVAAVDVGILNLTRYQPPAPDKAIFGQRRLSAEIRDLYGALIDGMQGRAGRLRSGGDESADTMSGSPPSGPPLALFSGIVKVGPDGKADVAFPIPAFDGTARVMAIAWTADRLGHAVSDVTIRDKVVALATLPRFLAAGDKGQMHLSLANVAGPEGDYSLEAVADGAISVSAPPARVPLKAGERRDLTLSLEGKGVGIGNLTVRVKGEGAASDISVERSFPVNVRPAYPDIARASVGTLGPGEGITLSAAQFADLLPGTGQVSLSVMPNTQLDVPALLSALDRYPYGCSEQVTSQAFPLLYLSEIAPLVSGMKVEDPQKRLADAVTRLLARQGSNGSFGLWSAGGEDTWLDAYVADFLSRAQEKGIAVPRAAFDLALDRLRNTVSLSTANARNTQEGLAYALYVLARNGRAPLGDLRYIADARLKDVETPLAKAQVGAALALLGDKSRAERVFDVALKGLPNEAAVPEAGRADFGSALRDAAALSVLAREAGMDALADAALERMETARILTTRTSTQENAWLVLAARGLARSASDMVIEVDGAARKGPFGRTFSRAEIEGKPVVVRNAGTEPLRMALSIDGPPSSPEPAAAKGFALSRAYFTPDGKPADLSRATQNQRFVVVLKAKEDEGALADVLLVDYLPAGFQIENPRLLEGGEESAFPWLGDTTQMGHMEFRDDRFVASLTRNEGDDPILVAYVVRAVSPGRYAHPPALIEDMYRPERFARTAAGTLEVAPAR